MQDTASAITVIADTTAIAAFVGYLLVGPRHRHLRHPLLLGRRQRVLRRRPQDAPLRGRPLGRGLRPQRLAPARRLRHGLHPRRQRHLGRHRLHRGRAVPLPLLCAAAAPLRRAVRHGHRARLLRRALRRQVTRAPHPARRRDPGVHGGLRGRAVRRRRQGVRRELRAVTHHRRADHRRDRAGLHRAGRVPGREPHRHGPGHRHDRGPGGAPHLGRSGRRRSR